MIWIIGGTTEARELTDRLGDLKDYIVTIATDGGKEFLNTDRVFIARLNKDEMISFARKNNIHMIVDLSHPYAKVVSENAKLVGKELNIKYLRHVRKRTDFKEGEIYLNSYEECYSLLSNIKGTVFFTTGSKNIGDFEKVKGENRFVYRILPTLESIQICNDNNIHMKDIVAILGPFSKELNKALLNTFKADYCIMKDSGDVGGSLEKVLACRELGIKAIIIGRKDEEISIDLETIEKIILKDLRLN